MRMISRLLTLLICASLTNSAFAQIVAYDNFQTDVGLFLNEKTLENGDQITLAPGTPRIAGDFTFEYYIAPSEFVGTETAQVRFYELDGGPISQNDPTPAPGSMFYDSGTLTLTESGRGRLTLFDLGVTLPDTFVWSVQLSGGTIGRAQGGVGGVTLYSPPTTGSNEYEFWQKVGNNWDLYFFDDFPTDFGATLTVVPEPWATPMVFLACAGLVAWNRRRNARKS